MICAGYLVPLGHRLDVFLGLGDDKRMQNFKETSGRITLEWI
jgi:hypothetical protein